MISEGNCEASSHSMTFGANSRTVRRSCCCSSERENSMHCLYHGCPDPEGSDAKEQRENTVENQGANRSPFATSPSDGRKFSGDRGPCPPARQSPAKVVARLGGAIRSLLNRLKKE